jgi:hypothetical protein
MELVPEGVAGVGLCETGIWGADAVETVLEAAGPVVMALSGLSR